MSNSVNNKIMMKPFNNIYSQHQLKLGTQGKYVIQEYQVKVSEHSTEDYCNTSPRNYKC